MWSSCIDLFHSGEWLIDSRLPECLTHWHKNNLIHNALANSRRENPCSIFERIDVCFSRIVSHAHRIAQRDPRRYPTCAFIFEWRHVIILWANWQCYNLIRLSEPRHWTIDHRDHGDGIVHSHTRVCSYVCAHNLQNCTQNEGIAYICLLAANVIEIVRDWIAVGVLIGIQSRAGVGYKLEIYTAFLDSL